MLENISIDHQLFNELGIDSEELANSFEKMSNKERSLSSRIDVDVLALLRSEYPETVSSNEVFIRSILVKNYKLCVLLHILARKIEKFDSERSKELYTKLFKRNAPSSIQKLILEAYLIGKSFDLVRKIHYTGLLKRGIFISCKNLKELDGVSIGSATSEIAEKTLRSLFRNRKKKQSINVWYVLNTDVDTAFFVFRKAKSRKSIPSSWKRGYDFVEYAKPLMFCISDNCKRLDVYSGEINQSIKFASSLVITSNPTVSLEQPLYQPSNTFTEKSKVDDFISKVTNGEDQYMELIELKFQPKKEFHDAHITTTKSRDNLKEMLKKIEEYFQTSINSNIVSQITTKYKNKLFMIYIADESEHEVVVCYTPHTKDFPLSREFEKYLSDTYKLKLNKKTR